MFERCMKFVGVAEGGANFDVMNGKPVLKRSARNDRGGPTKYGITWGTLARAHYALILQKKWQLQQAIDDAETVDDVFKVRW